MNRPGLLLTALLLAAVAVLFCFNHRQVSAQGNPRDPRTKWEYTVIPAGAEGTELAKRDLNRLGDEGWELAGTFGSVRGGGGGIITSEQHFVLKRPKR
jgi:hypothetical protein